MICAFGIGDDADLIRAKRAQKEKPFHFVQMTDVKNKWEHGEQNSKDERREERKQEIQSIRNRLFMVSLRVCASRAPLHLFFNVQGKQGKMKEAYQQAVMESESGTNIKRPSSPVEVCDTRSLLQKFEKGEVYSEESKVVKEKESDDMSVFESGKVFVHLHALLHFWNSLTFPTQLFFNLTLHVV